MENENVEIFEDEEIVTLYDENDNPVDFAEIACVEYEGNFYALLQPVDEIEDMADDEVMVCLLEPQDDETEIITPVTDEALAEKIFDVYLKALADDECCCGDDCDCNEHDDDCDCHKHEEQPKAKDTKKDSGCGCCGGTKKK